LQQLIPVFYRPEMTATSRFFAPGTFKPAACVEDWRRCGLMNHARDFAPASRDDLCLAHDPRYVDGVLAGRIRNGFNGVEPDVAASLPYTSGAMMAAAEEVALNGGMACAPVSGFHHARYDSAAGYCTFNGLIVTARHLQAKGYAESIGILDLDQHYGDGTDQIIERLSLREIRHISPGRDDRTARDAEAFLNQLADLVCSFGRCQVLLYQAGADPHVEDPLGGWMTTEQLAQRDRIVFDTAAHIGLPVAWNLAGGYQRDAGGGIEPVLKIHRKTMEACVRASTLARRA
jgi:acetoin utilization deacetylase AcuC-like enzyme